MFRIALLALVGANFISTETGTDINEEYGPETARRIALTRDADGTLEILFSNTSGPVRDGATEVIQATQLVDTDKKKSYLLTMQPFTDKVGKLTKTEWKLVDAFLEHHFSTRKKDVVLLSKSDKELQGKTVTNYLAVEGDEVTVKDVTNKIGDYVRTDGAMFLYQSSKISQIDHAVLDENFNTDVSNPAFYGSTRSVSVGQETMLARGPKVNGVETVAYIKDKDGKMQMTPLTTSDLVELDTLPFTGNYATADHSGNQVYVMKTLFGADIGDEKGEESFEVSTTPADQFGKKNSETAGYPTP